MNQLRRLMVFTVLLMAAGFVSGHSTKEVLAAEKYFKIGMNDSVYIDEDSIESNDVYVRFCPKKDGAITFSYTSADQSQPIAEIRLMKKTKGGLKAIPTFNDFEDFMENPEYSDDETSHGGESTVTYGVKKGVKYVLQIDEDFANCTLWSSFKSVKDNGGKKKGSAKTVKKGKKQYGMVPMTGKKHSRWYKFKVPKTKKVTVEFKGWSNSSLNYQIIVNGKKAVDREIYNNNWDYNPRDKKMGQNNRVKKMTAQLRKGTVVYLRVYTIVKGCSGYYYWKWN